jgi:hypothetical protein
MSGSAFDHGSVNSGVEKNTPVYGFGWSASHFSMEALDTTTHDFELQEEQDGRIHVHVDSRTMGVGGVDSWTPHLDEEFKVLPGRELETRVLFVPLSH